MLGRECGNRGELQGDLGLRDGLPSSRGAKAGYGGSACGSVNFRTPPPVMLRKYLPMRQFCSPHLACSALLPQPCFCPPSPHRATRESLPGPTPRPGSPQPSKASPARPRPQLTSTCGPPPFLGSSPLSASSQPPLPQALLGLPLFSLLL